MKHYQTAGSIIVYQGKILLIEHKPKTNKNRMWRHNTAAPFWAFPGGKKESQDADILATARREA